MSVYTPDNWVILRMTSPKETTYKILAGYHGGYTYGDSWKLSSGMVKVIEKENYYEFPQQSGSMYICNKHSEGLSGITANMYENWITIASIESLGNIEMISSDKFLEEWYAPI